ncbi:GNAT family N-acetyltransferase [Mycolicibacterium smegmatis]|uniref:GNAT family N-acetyltransferase n=1 Tax=Mycolicibacterium smegmatis TaxID=1772 RepID=UPI001E5262FC|nr:GNAT family N-acetyltransferase [Mycolicibacterium smegmatis]UGU33472.1 GNAT family N-acetyltransferase [Mycolicibacterium smegmatis]ULN68339.1 GNAT family N-acetyltransferase [Mycolicibacterium smegmatis]
MTVTENVGTWTVRQTTSHDHPHIADFLATTTGLGGKTFAADSRDVAEQLDGALPGSAVVLRGESGDVLGYAALHGPDTEEPEVLGTFVFAPSAPIQAVRDIVGDSVDHFHRVATPGSYLRVYIGADQPAAIAALTETGARRERQFISTRRSLLGEDSDQLAAEHIDGLTVLSWPQVISGGFGEEVRRLQFDTFSEHFGNMSKTPQRWEHHLHSRAFTPDFSLAAVDRDGVVVGYVLGSTYSVLTDRGEERSAHTDYIGVRRDRRERGTGELLLKKIWLAALRRGLTAASLGTDINNASNAHVLYRRLGYVAVRDEYAYRIDADGSTK